MLITLTLGSIECSLFSVSQFQCSCHCLPHLLSQLCKFNSTSHTLFHVYPTFSIHEFNIPHLSIYHCNLNPTNHTFSKVSTRHASILQSSPTLTINPNSLNPKTMHSTGRINILSDYYSIS